MKEPFSREWWLERLQGRLPGEKAQLMMAPTFRGGFPQQDEPARAAVLALLYPSGGETHLVFMKRNEYDGPHSAQISFPGGAWETKDGSLKNTAIRETREELGIYSGIEILGRLTPLYIPVSHFKVFPFLGWSSCKPLFRPDASEVQYLIEVSLRELLDPENTQSEVMHHHGRSIEAPFYQVGTEKIWGATAMMLSEVLQLAVQLP
jgi:8-oxo-dGTP pyrophosphatase MutT (NUDIX family)